MSNIPQVTAYGGSRITLLALVFTGLFLFAIVALPPSSRATRVISQTRAISRTSRSASGKRPRPEFVPGHVLVRYKDEVTAKRQQKAMTALSIKDRSIPIEIERFDAADMIAGLRLGHVAPDDTMTAIQALKARSDVLYAEPDFIMHADTNPNDPCFPTNSLVPCQSTSLYGLSKIGAPTAWNTTQGSGNVVVGVIDEGIDINHQDLQANIWLNPFMSRVPVSDVKGYYSLEYDGYRLGMLKNTLKECKERGMTFAAPLKVDMSLLVYEQDGEQPTISRKIANEVYIGEIPLMTERGTFVMVLNASS